MSDNIKVAIRVRQLIEKEHGQKSHWTIKDDSICCDEMENGRKSTPYMFDQIFDEQSVTMDVFEDICKPIVESALNGIHGTIFAYGQSSSGKTFTMSGTKMQPGVITLAIKEIFENIKNIEHKEFLIRIAYLEIYNEQVTDLLSVEENILKIREDSDRNIQISGLTEEIVNSLEQVMQVIKKGEAKRHTAETKQNDRSSRSHCILRVVLESRTVNTDDEAVKVAHLYFVDLAGSEKAAENSGDRFKEGCAINKSLFTLANVIRKLSGDDNMAHVSFRDSKLTRLLKNALGGNSKTAIICTITPAAIEESDSTLKFASRAKIIKNRPEVNEVMTDAALLKKYRREINMLQNKMKELNNTDIHMERVELEKKLAEKEEVEQKQAQLILKLQEMVVISGVDNTHEPPKKKRRETWCPGKATRGLTEKNFLPPIEEISPPQKKGSNEVASLCKTVDCAPPDMDTSLQLLDNVPAYRRSMAPPVDDTINANPYIKELFELQDKHEILLEEMRRKDQELEEMREFTELERECEKETISTLTEKLKALESSFPWLEEELMKTQQERNRLRAELESRNRQLSAVEDGTGLTKKSEQLSASEARVTSLSSDLDIQKSRYEFHLAQMKAKLEVFTRLLEEHGVNPEHIKQKAGGDIGHLNETEDLMAKHEQEVNDLRNEVDSYVQKLEKEQAKNCEMLQHFESQFEQQKELYQKDLQDVKDECEVFRQMFEEEREKQAEKEKFKADEGVENDKTAEIEAIKQQHEKEITDLKKELDNYIELLKAEREKSDEKTIEKEVINNNSEIEDLKQSHENEISNLKAELDKYVELLQSETEKSKMVTKEHLNDNSKSEMELMKEKYEEEINDLKMEVDKYVELLYAEREKSGAKTTEETISDLKSEIETLKQSHEEEVRTLRGEIEELQLQDAEDDELVKDAKAEMEAYMSERKLEMEKVKQKHDEEMGVLHAEVDKYMKMLKAKEANIGTETNGEIANDQKSAMVNMKQKYEAEISELKTELDQYVELVTADRDCGKVNESLNINSELWKAEYEEKIKSLEEDLETYKELLMEEQKKNEAVTAENDISLDNFSPSPKQDLSGIKEDLDLQTELLQAEKETEVEEKQTDLRSEMLASEMEVLKQNHEKELSAMKAELQLYADLLERQKQDKNLDVEKMEVHQSETDLTSGKVTEDTDEPAQGLQSELEKYIELLEEQKLRYSHLEEERTEERLGFDQQRLVYENTIKEIEEELHNVGATTQQLSTEIQRLEKVNRSLKDDKLNLVNQVSETENELERVKQLVPASETNHHELVTSLDRLNNENHLLETKSQELATQVEKLSNDNKSLKETAQELSAKAEYLHEVKYELEDKNQGLLGEVEGLNTVVQELREEISKTNMNCQELMAEVDRLEKINQTLQEESNNESDSQREVGLEIARLETLNHSIEKRSQELETEVERLETLITSLKEENVTLVTEKTEVQTKIDSLETVNGCLTEESKKLSVEVERLEAINQNLMEESKESLFMREEAERKVEVYDETLQELKADLQLLEEENLAMRNNLEQKTSDASNTNSELEHLKTHVSELEDDARVSAELIAEYDTEVKQLREKMVVLEASKTEDIETVKLELQEKYDSCVAERDVLVEQLRETESTVKVFETSKTELEGEISNLMETNDRLHKKLNQIEEEKIDIKLLNEMKIELEEKLNTCVSERDSLQRQLTLLEETSETKETVEQIRAEFEEKLNASEAEKGEIVRQLTEVRKDNTNKESLERIKNEFKDKFQTTETELNELRRKTSLLEEGKSSAEKMVETLQEEKRSLEEDLYQAEKNRPRQTLRINTVGSNEEWEKKWNEFVRDEKRKRVGLMLEMRDLRLELKKESERRENSLEEAMELAREEVRKQDMYEKLMEQYKKTDNEANILHSDLEDEKKLTKQLQQKVEEEMKVTAKLKQQNADLEKKLKSSSANGFVELSHSCNYKLEAFSLQRKLKEHEDIYQQRVGEYEDTVQMQEGRIAKLKNEIRRLQSMDATINFKSSSNQLSFNDTTPSSAKKTKTDVSACGSSSSGGIIDHFKVLVTETENKRLKKEIEKQASKMESQASKLAKYEELEKENITLKEELKKASKLKTVTEENGYSEPRHPLGDVIPNVGEADSISHSKPSAQKRKPRFEIPDLEPKKSDGRLIIDGEDMQEKVDNCKSQ